MSKTITRLFDQYADAVRAVDAIEALGVPHDHVSIVANKTARQNDDDHDDHDETQEDIGKGAITGTVLGGAGGLLAGLGMLAIPGLGPVVAAGWLVSTAVGAGVGALAFGAAGGVIGALKDAGESEEDAHVYSEGVRRGGTLVSAKVHDEQASAVEAIFDNNRSVTAASRGADYRAGGWSRFDETAPDYSDEQIAAERNRYRSDNLV
jgi:hypothetical protein